MRVSKDSKFIIYGAGVRGIALLKSLQEQGNVVTFFLDRDAENIRETNGIPVLVPDDCRIGAILKQEAIVFIAIADYFGQAAIAASINALGFQHIIFKSNFIVEQPPEYSQTINSLYERLCAGKTLTGLELPPYQNEIVSGIETCLLGASKGQVTALVPFEVLFTGRAEHFLSDKINYETLRSPLDLSCLYYHFDYVLFELFEHGFHPAQIQELQDYREIIEYERRLFSQQVDESYLFHTLNKKYHVFSEMSQALELNPNFFRKFPIKVQWNARGYFNIVDGHHRTAFFLAKHIWMVPCQMCSADYNLWRNERAVPTAQECIRRLPKRESAEIVLEHPCFVLGYGLNQNVISERNHLFTICRWLSKQRISPSGANVLILSRNGLYYARHLMRMGCMPYLYQIGACSPEIGAAVNPLMGLAPPEHFITDFKKAKAQLFDLVLCLEPTLADQAASELNYKDLITMVPAAVDREGFPLSQADRPGEEVIGKFYENSCFYMLKVKRSHK